MRKILSIFFILFLFTGIVHAQYLQPGGFNPTTINGTDCRPGATCTITAVPAGVVTPTLGGTGVANNAASTFTISGGAYSLGFTLGGNTSLTLPASGTLAKNDGSNLTIASQAIGDILTATSTTAYGRIAAVAAGQPLLSGGATTAPAYAGWYLSGTAAQTYTFPATTATLARIDAANTFTGTQVFNSKITGSISGNADGNAGTATTAGNITLSDTSNTRKFLRELSVGGVFQSPAWDAIIDGDLPATIKGLTLAPQAEGFTVAGGTTPATLTVDETSSMSSKAPLVSPTFTGTPTAPTAPDNTLTTQLATTAFTKGELAVLRRHPTQAVATTYAASGSSGISTADNAVYDNTTNSFAFSITETLPSWTAASILKNKYSGASGVKFEIVVTSGIFRLTINSTVYDSTVPGGGAVSNLVAGTSHQITPIINVGTTTTTVSFYLDGVLLNTTAAQANTTIANTDILYLMGTSAIRTAGSTSFFTILNFSPTAAETLDLYRNGIPESWKWGSQTAKTSGTLVTGKKYRINTFVAGDDFANIGGTNVTGNEFTATGTTPTTWTNSSSLVEIGATLSLQPEGINSTNWLDSSSNVLNATYPATGWSLTRPDYNPNLTTANTFTNIAPMTTPAESWIGPSSTTGIYFKGGNVGIGTTVPDSKLHVAGSEASNWILEVENSSNTSALYAANGTGYGAAILAGSNSSASTYALSVTGSGGNYLYVRGDGNVGIGTTTFIGTEKLRVVSDIYADGNVSALTFTDRTPHYEGDALADILKISGKDGQIDHATLPEFAQAKKIKNIYEKVELKEVGKEDAFETVSVEQDKIIETVGDKGNTVQAKNVIGTETKSNGFILKDREIVEDVQEAQIYEKETVQKIQLKSNIYLDSNTGKLYQKVGVGEIKEEDGKITQTNLTGTEEQPERDLGAMISILTKAVQQLVEKVQKLEGE